MTLVCPNSGPLIRAWHVYGLACKTLLSSLKVIDFSMTVPISGRKEGVKKSMTLIIAPKPLKGFE